MKNQVNYCEAQTRNIAFDILRLISMLMVIMLHITGHGLANVDLRSHQSSYWLSMFLNTFSLVAVNCFVLISGYFLSSQTISARKLISLWTQVWTYSVTVYVILCLIPGVDVQFRLSTLVECLCPLLSNQYWFFTCYFLLYLIAPILNKLAQSWDQKEYRNALAVLLIVFSLIPSVSIWGDSFGTNRGYSLIWFTILYLIAAYLRKFDFHLPVHPAVVYLIPCVALCILQAVVSLLNPDFGSVQALLNNQCSYNGPLVLCASIGLFVWARSAPPKTGKGSAKIITMMASLSFGIYLLHDHGSIRTVLWNDWVCLKDTTANSGAFLFRIILVLIILFVVGLAAEFARQKVMAGIRRIFYGRNQNSTEKI